MPPSFAGYTYCSRDHSEYRFMKGNLDSCFDLKKSVIPMGHVEEITGMSLDVELEVIRHFWARNANAECQHRTGYEHPGKGFRAEGPGLSPGDDWWV